MITGKTEATYLAILLDYHQQAATSAHVDLASRVYLPSSRDASHSQDGSLQVSFIGAGEFAQHFLLPPLKHLHGLQLRGVSTARGLNAHTVARKFGFRFCTTDNAELLHDPETHCVFIATRHHLHAPLVVQALEQHKHVFVEKPLALSKAELEAIIAAYDQSRGELMVGFNRRFAPVLREAKHFFQPRQTPLVIHYRVNAGFVPRTHWTQNPLEGGGRILGEVCHFVDTILYLTDAKPMTVYAEAITSSNTDMVEADNVNITMKLSDGSLGIITYVALGESSIGKERIEIFGDNAVFVLNDFKTAEFVQKNHKPKHLKVRSKGHREEVKAFIEALQAHRPAPAAFSSLVLTTLTTLTIRDSLSQKRPIDISSPNFDL
jgi:polar amino acid transport system substrate-binding protein